MTFPNAMLRSRGGRPADFQICSIVDRRRPPCVLGSGTALRRYLANRMNSIRFLLSHLRVSQNDLLNASKV